MYVCMHVVCEYKSPDTHTPHTNTRKPSILVACCMRNGNSESDEFVRWHTQTHRATVCMYVYIYECMYSYVCMYVCMYVLHSSYLYLPRKQYSHANIHTYIHTYIHTHTTYQSPPTAPVLVLSVLKHSHIPTYIQHTLNTTPPRCMCMCMCVTSIPLLPHSLSLSLHVGILDIHVCECIDAVDAIIHTQTKQPHTDTHSQTPMKVRMYIYIYIYVCICMHVCMCVRMKKVPTISLPPSSMFTPLLASLLGHKHTQTHAHVSPHFDVDIQCYGVHVCMNDTSLDPTNNQ